ncbi:methyltransferase [Paraliobacillus quinghaiensis]|uniref:Methyltransferase n=1 Tax=Paraliobacillus quinghaiensis TaxID=470815 RepID=A0A917TCS2_9BACI|nr:RNA methyltransferase [Paraliobacillus quinghaiensis]GGM18831.1 methyltransferase [Paraliobacillus quinghaiensis]
MNIKEEQLSHYVYSCAYPEDEKSLCALEMRAFFNKESTSNVLESTIAVDPTRSPFLKERIHVMCEGENIEELIEQVKEVELNGETFKIIYVKNPGLAKDEKEDFEMRRTVEKEVGLHVTGEPDLDSPDRLLGVMHVNGRWIFGDYAKNEPVWLHHQNKPHSYSTSLNTRVARAVVNIAIPNPIGIKAIDPCCGIGTVLVEAQSMGIDIVGSDRNPLIMDGARENSAHFGFTGKIHLQDIRDVTGQYDVAIIDLPYNLCSVITYQEQLEMLQSARSFAKKVVVVTVEPIDDVLDKADFNIVDRAVAKKGQFIREVIVCE